MNEPRRCQTARKTRWGDRGSGTLFGLFLVTVVLLLAAVVVEGGNAMTVRGHATDLAQQAARAGADKLDLNTLRTSGVVQINPAQARTAATAYLARFRQTGTVAATPAGVTVTVTLTEPTVLAPALGITTITVTSTAHATPQPS
jgi:Flp pilus assembly protein TadG